MEDNLLVVVEVLLDIHPEEDNCQVGVHSLRVQMEEVVHRVLMVEVLQVLVDDHMVQEQSMEDSQGSRAE